jgi:hypothetical protein
MWSPGAVGHDPPRPVAVLLLVGHSLASIPKPSCARHGHSLASIPLASPSSSSRGARHQSSPNSRSGLLRPHFRSSPNRVSPSRRAPLLRECSEVWLPGLCCFVAATSDGDGPGSAQLCLAAMHALSARLCCFADLSTIDCSVGLG